ncbi:hypothetical protein BU24DRAFT_356902 [Aaosphaeria arxii CBS 175.79]|uniref:Uncharacterized protein n=1 Tax=Aaosphaeria arxii CBS 175.79 TaxID=1450172 RepID=A0A6A5XB10_9PLEO|nr:uncharacterized protein BU24DRAFT_356902 [Aaosphaeria arxii CBS 175.79]KAF2010131.1 hypothetical protein BU24DRAFT_356902 [Aaosphaeria arxii CBS 175.79]
MPKEVAASTVTEFEPYAPSTTTASASRSTFTGDASYPVFPNANYISRFAIIADYLSDITHLDTDLLNRCYLPSRPHRYVEPRNQTKREDSWIYIKIEKPDYQEDSPPCHRQGAINTNCRLQNTNGTFSGLRKYEDNFDEQQHCFCEKYPFFEATLGCQKCLEMHGGIEGWHWFPESYISAAADAYCSENPPTKEFFDYMLDWKATAAEAQIPSTTAEDLLGTRTEVSLYYTASPTTGSKKNTSMAEPRARGLGWVWTVACISVVIGALM